MSLKTAFLNLFKPEAGDRFSITGTEGYNKNMDMIDAAVKKNAGDIAQLNSDITEIVAKNVKDLDNPPNAYILQTTTYPVGLPSEMGANACTVIQQNPGGNSWNSQLAFSFGSNIAIRVQTTGAWGPWRYVAFK